MKNMSQYKKFILYFFLFSCMAVFILPITNIYIDRYRVFNAVINHKYDTYYWRKDGKWEFNHNDRIIPMSFLLNNKHKFDSFIFGNSKIGDMDVRQLGPTWYKLNYNSANMTEHLHNAKLLIKNINVKNIILTVDLEYFYDLELSTQYKKSVYPSNTLAWFYFYRKYLFKRIDTKDINFLFHKDYNIVQKTDYFIRTKSNDNRLFIASNSHLKHVNKLTGLRYKETTFVDNKISKTLSMIKELKFICKQKGINFTMLFVPFHYKNMLQANPNVINHIKKELVSIDSFYDFTLPHNYLVNNAFWRETFHYTKALNDDIIRKLKHEDEICPKFGTLLTPKNIDLKLKESFSLYQEILPSLLQKDQQFFPHPLFKKKTNTPILSINSDKIRKNCLNYYLVKENK